MKKVLCLCLLLLLAAGCSYGQSNEVSFSAGAAFTSGQTLTTTFPTLVPCPIPNCNLITGTMEVSRGFTFEASYARRLVGAGPMALYLELPLLETPGHGVDAVVTTLNNPFNASTSSSLFFLTPSARIKFFSSAMISPWATVGGGWAHLTVGVQNASTGALQFGGGADFKTGVPHLGLRVEARDFWSAGILQPLPVVVAVGLPAGTLAIPSAPLTLTTTASPTHQHHLFAGGGVVLRF